MGIGLLIKVPGQEGLLKQLLGVFYVLSLFSFLFHHLDKAPGLLTFKGRNTIYRHQIEIFRKYDAFETH